MPTLMKQYNEAQAFACMSAKDPFHGVMWSALRRASFVLWTSVTIDRVGYGERYIVSTDINATRTHVILMLPSSSEQLGASVNVTCKKESVINCENKMHFLHQTNSLFFC
jgi:hypothetical protein